MCSHWFILKIHRTCSPLIAWENNYAIDFSHTHTYTYTHWQYSDENLLFLMFHARRTLERRQKNTTNKPDDNPNKFHFYQTIIIFMKINRHTDNLSAMHCSTILYVYLSVDTTSILSSWTRMIFTGIQKL